jgi:hypothetical protein
VRQTSRLELRGVAAQDREDAVGVHLYGSLAQCRLGGRLRRSFDQLRTGSSAAPLFTGCVVMGRGRISRGLKPDLGLGWNAKAEALAYLRNNSKGNDNDKCKCEMRGSLRCASLRDASVEMTEFGGGACGEVRYPRG